MTSFRYSIQDPEGREVTVWAQKIKGVLWVHYKGETFSFLDESHNTYINKNKNLQNPFEIVSPMPGKITNLGFNVGDDVKEGQVVITLEAMKMEYSLTSTINSKIKKINVIKGQLVTLGEVLIEFERI